MLPDLSLLIAIILGLYSLQGEPADLGLTLGGVVASMVGGLVLTRMAADRGVAAVARKDLPAATASLRWTSLWPLLAWWSCLYVFRWGAFVLDAVPRIAWLGRYAVLFAPAAVVFVGGWVGRSRIETAVREIRGGVDLAVSPGGAVRQHLRRNALALVPLFGLLAIFEGLHVLGALGVPGLATASQWVETLPLLTLAASMTVLALFSLFLPAALRRIFRTGPLPPGELRTLLERTARAIGLRYRELVVWRTGGKVLNAMVVGLTGGTRVIFLTDGLLERLPTDEVLAVFGHEAGHAKRHHLPLYLVVFFAFALLFDSIGGRLVAAGVPMGFLAAAQLGFVWFGLVGWLSRKFEREADVYGADHAAIALPPEAQEPGTSGPLPPGASAMVRALDRIARTTGHGQSFRHGSIEDRIRYVVGYATDAERRRAFRRERRTIYSSIAGFSLVALAVGALELPGQVRLADASIRFDRAREVADEAERLQRDEGLGASASSWKAAFDQMTDAEAALGDSKGHDADLLRLGLSSRRADVALRHLADRTAARREFERVLVLAAPDRADQPMQAFLAHVDLGRILAGEDQLGAARRHFEQARSLMPEEPGQLGELLRAHVDLLQAVIEAREGLPTARAHLQDLARKPRYDDDDWRELAADARDDLALLP